MIPEAKRVFTVCVTVFVLGALVPAWASAATTGWMVNGTMLSGSESLATTAAVDQEGVLTIGTTEIVCSGSTVNGTAPVIEAPNRGKATSLEFAGCKTTATSPCTLAGGNAGGVIGTLPVTSEVTLEGTSAVLETIKPGGSIFTTIAFTGGSCALSGKQSVTGEALVEGPTSRGESTLQLDSAITTRASGDLKVGSTAASATGSALLALQSLKTWGYL
jgi:hypothetical protein